VELHERPHLQIVRRAQDLCYADSLFRRIRDFVFKVAGAVISAELAQRRLVQVKQDVAQLLGRRITRGETLSVNLAQRANENVAVLVADFAIVIAVAIVETGLAHAALHGAYPGDTIRLPGPNGNLALQPRGTFALAMRRVSVDHPRCHSGARV
jgi:hypothetical protein